MERGAAGIAVILLGFSGKSNCGNDGCCFVSSCIFVCGREHVCRKNDEFEGFEDENTNFLSNGSENIISFCGIDESSTCGGGRVKKGYEIDERECPREVDFSGRVIISAYNAETSSKN